MADELQVTTKAARDALARLVDARMLTANGTLAGQRGRPAQLYVSEQLLGLVGASPLRR